ncbi:MAG: hypothetical protein ACLUD0_03220 [Eubacterium ramulus]
MSVTPIATDWCGAACKTPEDYVTIAKTLRPCGNRSRCQLHWRIFRIGKQRYDNCG